MSNSIQIIIYVISFYLILIFLLLIIFLIFEKPQIKELKKEPYSEVRILIRNKIRKDRIFQHLFTYLYLFIGVILCYTYQLGAGIMATLFLMVEFLLSYKDLSINISTMDFKLFKKRFLNKSFCLYLRGFSTDNYACYREINQPFKNKLCELALRKVLKSYTNLDMVAVGMTKEIDSPLGAIRIYLDDNIWKEDVKFMIHNAKYIYILVDDSDSCIWEILEARQYLKKTCFIIDDLIKYTNVRQKCHTIEFPEICFTDNQIAFIFFNNDSPVVHIIDNNISQYRNLVFK